MQNVLLMLSENAAPAPRSEMAWHAQRAAPVTWVPIAHTLDLTRGRSHVAFYGDAACAHMLHGRGTLDDYLDRKKDQQRFLDVLAGMPIYAELSVDARNRFNVLVGLKAFQQAAPNTPIDTLGGTLRNRRPLTAANLPIGHARAKVYYVT